MVTVPTVPLSPTVNFPMLTLGVLKIPRAETIATIHQAVELGYRSFDTSPVYENEGAVGEAVRTAGVARDQLFVTTKLWNCFHGYDSALRAFDDSLARLGLDFVDLYLIHWPVPAKDLYVDSWRALLRLREEGRARAIGVSNFLPPQLRRIIAETGATPAVNQVELHIAWQQRELRSVHAELGIRTQAWSPLGRGGLLDHPAVGEVARRLGRSPAQVILRWLTQRDVLPVVKASGTGHLQQNLDIFSFSLDETDLARIDALDSPEGRFGPDPMSFLDLPSFQLA